MEAAANNALEDLRRKLSWLCVVVFSASFVGLLAFSSTSYWTPANPWIGFLDGAWRISGVIGLCLWTIPYVLRATRWVRGS